MDLETLLTSPSGFGLESASFLQRARCRILDGAPLDDLLARASDFDRRCLGAAIGCEPSALPVGAPPVEFGDFAPVRTGKSLELAALVVARSQTVDVSIVKPGQEPPRISLLATQLDQATAIRGHLNVIGERPHLRSLVIGGTDSDVIVLRHPSGCPIPVHVLAAGRGGYTLAARFQALVAFDEAPGWHSTDKIVSLEDSRDQALGRMLPGGQVVYAGSVWQPSGFCFQLDRDHFGKPTADVVVMRPRTVDEVTPAEQLNPVFWTPARIAHARRTMKRSFKMHVLNEFGGASTVFDFDAVMRAFRKWPPVVSSGRPFGIIDASSGKKDTWAYGIAQWCRPAVTDADFEREPVPGMPDGALVVDETDRPVLRRGGSGGRPFLHFWCIDGFEGEFWSQWRADEIVGNVSKRMLAGGVTTVHGDQREAYALEAEFRRNGLRFVEHPYTAESKARAVERVRRWLRDDAAIFTNHDRLRQELLSFVEKPTPAGGFTFGARGNGHDDFVALVLTAALADMDGDLPRSPIAQSRERFNAPSEALG